MISLKQVCSTRLCSLDLWLRASEGSRENLVPLCVPGEVAGEMGMGIGSLSPSPCSFHGCPAGLGTCRCGCLFFWGRILCALWGEDELLVPAGSKRVPDPCFAQGACGPRGAGWRFLFLSSALGAGGSLIFFIICFYVYMQAVGWSHRAPSTAGALPASP